MTTCFVTSITNESACIAACQILLDSRQTTEVCNHMQRVGLGLTEMIMVGALGMCPSPTYNTNLSYVSLILIQALQQVNKAHPCSVGLISPIVDPPYQHALTQHTL